MESTNEDPITVIAEIPKNLTKKAFGDLFLQARLNKSAVQGTAIIQQDVADHLIVSQEYICRIEAGTAIPSNKRLEQLAKFFEGHIVSAEALIYQAMCFKKPGYEPDYPRPSKIIKGRYEHLPDIETFVALMEAFEDALERKIIRPELAKDMARVLLNQFRICVRALEEGKAEDPTCEVTRQ